MDGPTRSRANAKASPPSHKRGTKRLFEVLLPLQPLTGILSAVTVRFQAHHDRLDNDALSRPQGVWREVWYGNSSPLKNKLAQRPTALGLMYNRGSVCTILYQLVEQKVGQSLASAVCSRYLERATNDRGDFKHVKAAFEEGNIWPHLGLYAGYLAVKCSVFAGVYIVSHPLSILRTVVLMRGDVPSDNGFWANWSYASPWADSGLYWSSLGAHMVSGAAEVCLSDFTLRTLRYFCNDYLTRQARASGASRRRSSDEALPGTHLERLRARLNHAAVVSALQVASSFLVHTVLFPLVTVRMRLEAQGGVADAPVMEPLRHLGLVDCARSIYELEGPSGFFRGFSSHLVTFAGNALWIGLIYGLSEAYIALDVDDEDD